MENCIVCQKHQDFSAVTGEPILEKGGWVVTHFPYLNDEKATKGYLLIETRRHIRDFPEMNAEEAAALGELIQKGSALIQNKMGAEHVYLFRINDKVAHLHLHLAPRYPNTPKEFWGMKVSEWTGNPKVDLQGIQETSRLLKDS